ncbi:MAG: acyltransferase family protein [Candidatus Binatia bacterium]
MSGQVNTAPAHAGAGAAVPADAMLGVARSRRFFPELESLRGLAVLLVVAFHVDASVVLYNRSRPASALTSFARGGDTGVDLFFVLSGFLLSLPFIAAARGERPVSLRLYFSRRALRILPLYYAAVLAGAVLAARQLGDLRHALPYLFFVNGFTGTSTPLPPFSNVWWSLATEVQFYLVLPLLLLVLRSWRGRALGAVALVAYGLAYLATVDGRLHMDTIGRQFVFLLSIVGRGPLFLSGIAAAWIVAVYGDRLQAALAKATWLRRGGADLVFAVVLVGLAYYLRALVDDTRINGGLSAPALPWHAGSGLFWAAVVLCLVLTPLRSKAYLCNAALARLGVLSFSIYLLHVPILHSGLRLARHVAPDLWGWSPRMAALIVVLGIACYAAATVTYTWIERPFLVRKSRFE